MASKPSKTKPIPNTPAPAKPETAADVTATVAAPAATQAAASTVVEGEQLPSEGKALPPAGESVNAEAAHAQKVTAPADGEELPPIDIASVIVTSEVEGFRRAGRAWSRTPTEVAIAELSDAAIEALQAEPLLQVAFVAAQDEKAA